MRGRMAMKQGWIALLSVLAGVGAVADESLAPLGWLGGCWAAEREEPGSVEQWTAPAGGTMFGLSRTIKGGRTVSFEFMRLRADALGKPVFTAWPGGRGETSFPLLSHADGEVVFQNLTHDFPQRIRYRQLDGGQRLHARIEGQRAGEARAIDFPMRRVACDPGTAPAR